LGIVSAAISNIVERDRVQVAAVLADPEGNGFCVGHFG